MKGGDVMPLAKEVAKTKGAILLTKDSYNTEFSTNETLMEFLDNMKAYAIKEREEILRQLKKGSKA